MSYPHMSGYYRSSSNAQSSQQGYAGARDTTPNANGYQNQTRGTGDNRQQSYGPVPYDWSSQNHSAVDVGSQGTYAGNSSWQNRAGTGSQDYQRSYYAPVEQASAAPQRYQSRDPYNSQNTQGLNNLAYVSGFESAAAANTTRSSTNQNAGVYSHPTVNSTGQNNVSIPPTSYDQRPPVYSQPSMTSISQYDQTQRRHESPSAANQNLALDAAAALAGAMQARYSQHESNPDAVHTADVSQSPRARNMQAVAQNTIQRTTSPHIASKPKENTRPKSSQARSSAGRVGGQTPAASQPQSQQQPSGTSIYQQPSATQSQSTQQNPTSISNLVTAPDDAEQDTYGNVEQQEPMPNYIDPTQVFNPYHREYERRKQEAAEAEARRKAEEQRQDDEKQKAAERAALEKSTESITAANSKSKITKKANVTTPGAKAQKNKQPSVDTPDPASQEEAMAAEMKNFMSKMKEFKSSNPSLFQKLWNDMRGGGSAAAAAAVAETHTTSPQVTQASLHIEPETNEKSSSKKPEKVLDASPIPRNGFKAVIENNPEGLPDLGRFPAERRIRQSHARTKGEQRTDTQQTSAPIPPTETGQAQKAGTTTRPEDPTTIWPEPRRRAVAIAAIHFLKTNPENANLKLTAQEICSILEQNPSYLDLCTALESRGFKFHKSLFARELLRSVPELQSSSSKGHAARSISSVAHGPSPPPPPPIPAAAPQLSSAAQEPDTTKTPALSSTTELAPSQPNRPPAIQRAEFIFYGQSGLKTENGTAVAKQPSKPSKSKPPSSAHTEPPIGAKEAAARKRDFADLIDLTNLDDNDNYVMPRKQPRTDAELTSRHFQNLSTGIPSNFNQNVAPLRFNPQAEASLNEPLAPPYKYGDPFITEAQKGGQYLPMPPMPPVPPMPSREKKPSHILANRIQSSEALQKSYYDPKTVARDILIASGRHPSERPLNYHLAHLLGNFIEIDSDVSTIYWDAIDPEGPPVPKVEFVDIPAVPPKYKIGERIGRRIKSSAIDKIEKTRGPEEASPSGAPRRSPQVASSFRNSPQPPSLSNKGSPGADPEHANKRAKLRHERTPKAGDRDQGVQQEGSVNRKISIDLPIHSSQRSSRSVSALHDQIIMQANPTPPKKRGRPVGSKNKHPSFAVMKKQAQAVLAEATEKPPEPVLHSYKCKWVKCNADLHNIETLKRHVWKKHAPSENEIRDAGFTCWWKRCQYLEEDEEKKIVPVHSFPDHGQWVQHIEEDHIQPIAAKYGDGPKSSHTGKPLDFSQFRYHPPVGSVTRTSSHTDPQSVEQSRNRYLADEHNRLTTPPVSSDGNPDKPSDAMILTEVHPGAKNDKAKADSTAQNAFMKARGSKGGDTRKVAEEVVRAMEVRKQKIGPGIDRGGCTLINEAQRSTFIQSPGVSRVVDADY